MIARRVVHGRFWLVNVICLLNCDNERDLCQLLDAAFAFNLVCDQGSHGLWLHIAEKADIYLLGLCGLKTH